MHSLELNNNYFICEVCGEGTDNPTTMGIESGNDAISLIKLCHGCGPIDLDVMQLCREVTIGYTNN